MKKANKFDVTIVNDVVAADVMNRDGKQNKRKVMALVNDGQDTYEVEIDVRPLTDWFTTEGRKDMNAKGRLYSNMDEAIVTQFCGEKPAYTLRGVDVANDKAWDTYNRLYVKTSKAIFAAVLAEMGMDVSEARFSRKAGCSCPCSPGWILADKGVTVFVRINPLGTAQVEADAEAQRNSEREARRAQAIAKGEANLQGDIKIIEVLVDGWMFKVGRTEEHNWVVVLNERKATKAEMDEVALAAAVAEFDTLVMC